MHCSPCDMPRSSLAYCSVCCFSPFLNLCVVVDYLSYEIHLQKVPIMWVVFLPRQTRRPQVRQPDQSHRAAGSTGRSDHWTGSSVSVSIGDDVSAAGSSKTTHTQSHHNTNTHSKYREWEVRQQPINFQLELSLWLISTLFYWSRESCRQRYIKEKWRGWLTGKGRRTQYIKIISYLLSVVFLYPLYHSEHSLSNLWVHWMTTSFKYILKWLWIIFIESISLQWKSLYCATKLGVVIWLQSRLKIANNQLCMKPGWHGCWIIL